MTLTRRAFGQRLTLSAIWLRLAWAAGATGIAITEVGCNLFNDILNWVPVGEAAVNSILTVLTGNGVVISPALQAIVATIEAGFTALTAAVKEYQSTTPAPVGALAKIQTAFKDVVDNFSLFLKSLSISAPLIAIVVGLAQIVFSTIAAFMNRLPQPAAMKGVLIGATVTVGSTSAPVVPKERSRRAFKKDWNSELDLGPKVGVVVPKAAYMPISFFQHL